MTATIPTPTTPTSTIDELLGFIFEADGSERNRGGWEIDGPVTGAYVIPLGTWHDMLQTAKELRAERDTHGEPDGPASTEEEQRAMDLAALYLLTAAECVCEIRASIWATDSRQIDTLRDACAAFRDAAGMAVPS